MLRYSPGEWFAVVTPETAALLSSALGDAAVVRVWAAMADGEGLGAVLGALVGSFGTSMSALPPFAVITYDADAGTANVVVRGPLRAELTTAGGTSQEVSGLGVTTWQERTVTDVVRIVVAEPGGATPVLPVRDGVVRAGRLDWTLREDAAPGAEPASDGDMRLAHGGPLEEAPVVSPASSADAPSGETTVLPGETRTQDDDGDGDDDDEAASALSDETTGYDDLLFGETRIATAEAAAVRAAAGLPATPDPPSSPTPSSAAPPSSALPVPPPAPVPPARSTPPAPRGMIGAIPPAGPGPSISTGTAAAGDLGDHDGETISAEQLAAMLGAASAAATPRVAPAPASGDPRSAPVLVVSTGETVTLDRSAVIGRRPRALRASGAVPHLVTVASPSQDISRSHVELRVDGMDVVAVDLDTVNGTKLLRQGAEPVRLHPGEATLLVAGDRLDLGDGVVLGFEGLR